MISGPLELPIAIVNAKPAIRLERSLDVVGGSIVDVFEKSASPAQYGPGEIHKALLTPSLTEIVTA
jgi:hypothetical protein